jgi:hypothetical protein
LFTSPLHGRLFVRSEKSATAQISPRAYVNGSPEDLEEAREAFAACEYWLERKREGWWPCFWNANVPLFWLALGVSLILLQVFIGVYTSTATPTSQHKAEAREMLRRGLAKEDTQRAVELTLAIVSGYEPAAGSGVSIWWFFAPCMAGLVACIALSVAPRTVIGVGKGEKSLKRWRAWIKFVSVTVPLFIFGAFLVPMLRDLLKFW